MKPLLRFLGTAAACVVIAACGSKGTRLPETDDELGAGGAPPVVVEPVGELRVGFDDDTAGWRLVDSNSDMGVGIDPVPSSDINVEWSKDGGNPGGALRCEVGYSDKSQWVSFGVDMTAMPEDLTGLVISAEVQILEGVGDDDDLKSAPAGAKLFAKSGSSYTYANGAIKDVGKKGVWQTIYFDLSEPSYIDDAKGVFNPAEIREIGIQFDSSSTSQTAQPGVWLIDNIRY